MKKKGIAPLGFLLNPRMLVIIAIILIIYFGFVYTGSVIGSDCNLGSWGVSSYNPMTKELVISYGGNVHSNGCWGTYNVGNKGSSIPDNQKDCEEIGWTWYPSQEGNCRLTDENWIKDKVITSTGGCVITCTDPRGCGGCGLKYGESTTESAPSFNGITISASRADCSLGASTTCSGTFIIKPKEEIKIEEEQTFSILPETPEETPTFSILPEQEVIKEVECLANLDCSKTCGSDIPTCSSNKCYCDAKRTENPEKIEVKLKLNIFDRIANYIQNFIDEILGWFG